MARDTITVQLPTYDKKDSVGVIEITKQAVTQANGIEILKAYANKDNSLKVIVENTTGADTEVTIKAGEKQNAVLGDETITVKNGKTVALTPIRDMARFERNNGSVYLDFKTGFTGNIYALGEKAGL